MSKDWSNYYNTLVLKIKMNTIKNEYVIGLESNTCS